MRAVAVLVYVPLQLVLLPLLLVAALAFAYCQIWVSRRVGVSQTGIEVSGGRVHRARSW